MDSWGLRAGGHAEHECEISWDNIFNGSTSGGVPQAWGVSGYPTTFLLDAEGRIRFKGLRHDAVAPEVEALLAEQSNSE